MFVDRAVITVRAGKGGDGKVSFRRGKYEPKGGPNGGNGGKGGDVVIVSEDGMSTLYDLRFQAVYAAQDGEAGGQKQCSGKDGEDFVLKLPPGTMIFDHQTGAMMHDLGPGGRHVIAKGGRGGFGNEHFKSSINQAPRTAEAGEPGQQFQVRLELKLIAEVGLIGMPNAGKSTLLKALTRANPKIADYPFTTLSPQLGIAEVDGQRRIVLADIPGLIEGAAGGAGLGLDFLRHVERTRVLVHLLDASPPDGTKPADNYRTVRRELEQYSVELAERPELIVLNKMDLFPDDASRRKALLAVCRDLELRPGTEALAISGAAGVGLPELLERLWLMLHPRAEQNSGWKASAPAV
ncbi:MAG: GTPase ObgE [Phycisphaeraceae bacterium]|nr:MAG: GTPase ObgE [Phycisphaeraceae bacterium]